MNLRRAVALALDPALLLRTCGLEPDPWQCDLLRCPDRQVLLNCCRQAGKSSAVAALALHTALFRPAGPVLLLSPSLRQSSELFRKVLAGYRALGRPVRATHLTQLRLELANGARVVCLPGREDTVRSFGGVSLLVLDEAARIPDDLYRAVRPMLAVSRGRLVALSTPFGRRGWFYREWHGDGPWKRVRITWKECPRLDADFIAEETRALGPDWVDQEYNAMFTAREGLVYPDFEGCVVAAASGAAGRAVGGLDFGWRNPFAAVWGVLDREDVLWITGERYLRRTPLHEHAAALRALPGVTWYADPAGRTEIEELRAAGLAVRAGDNALAAGIAAVTARLRTGRLKVVGPACPQLVNEARLYRYPADGDGETPQDDHNHALAALRYLVSRLDARRVANPRRPAPPDEEAPAPEPWLRLDNDALWTEM
jgi:hypothetical protein